MSPVNVVRFAVLMVVAYFGARAVRREARFLEMQIRATLS